MVTIRSISIASSLALEAVTLSSSRETGQPVIGVGKVFQGPFLIPDVWPWRWTPG
jgi:hypothetical protein